MQYTLQNVIIPPHNLTVMLAHLESICGMLLMNSYYIGE